MLAQLLEWHRREDKVDWWEFFRLNEMADDELLDERGGIAGLTFESRLETTKRGVVGRPLSISRHRTPTSRSDDDALRTRVREASRSRRSRRLDLEHRTIDLRKGVGPRDLHPTALFKHDRVSNPEAAGALLRLGEFVRDHGIDGPGRIAPPAIPASRQPAARCTGRCCVNPREVNRRVRAPRCRSHLIAASSRSKGRPAQARRSLAAG